MLKIGMTGGIGSGKTTVCKIFEQLGAPVYYADERAKYLIQHYADLKESIKDVFGPDAYDQNGVYNRKWVASVVFNNKYLLDKLNALVHPIVRKDSLDWYEQHRDKAYTIREAALLFESGAYKDMDINVMVYAPEETRIARVLKRDDISVEEVQKRMQAQWPEHQKQAMSDCQIINDGSTSIVQQVLKLHEQWSNQAKT